MFVVALGYDLSSVKGFQLRNLEMDLIQDKNKSLWNGLLIGHSAPSFIVFSHDLLSLVRGDTCTRKHTHPTHIHGFRRMREVDPKSWIWMQWAVRVGNGGQYVSWDRGGWILHCGGDETWRATGRWRHWGRAGTAQRSVRHLMERRRRSSERHKAHYRGATQTRRGWGGGAVQDWGWFPDSFYSTVFPKHDEAVSKNTQPLYA